MENIDSFEEFLRKKKDEENSNRTDWPARLDKWLESIDVFYMQIREWLTEFEQEGFLRIVMDKEVNLNEEFVGSYKTKRMDIYIGNDLISIIPKGTLIIGSYGRLDMRGTKGEILIIQPEWNDWKFAKRTPRLETWDVKAESFKKILQDLV